jgi:transposase-like protein
MTVKPSIDPARVLEEQLDHASPDLLRSVLQTFVNTLLSAEAEAVCGADYGQVSPDRTNRRNGHRHRDFDTRSGTLGFRSPETASGFVLSGVTVGATQTCREGADSVVATCYLLGVSTRRMDKLVETLRITGLSKSQVSAAELDAHMEEVCIRSLGKDPFSSPRPTRSS